MGYGLMNKCSKKWVAVVSEGVDELPRFNYVTRSKIGIWFNTKEDARVFMKEHLMKDTQFRIVSYSKDYRKQFFEKGRDTLLEIGWQEIEDKVFRPDGSRYY